MLGKSIKEVHHRVWPRSMDAPEWHDHYMRIILLDFSDLAGFDFMGG